MSFNHPSANAESFSSIHGPVVPGDVYLGTNIKAMVRVNKDTPYTDVNVYRISPFGVELALEEKNSFLLSQFGTGAVIDLIIHMGSEECTFDGFVVSTSKSENNKTLIGIRWYKPQVTAEQPLHAERRKSKRWNCPEEFLPTGTAPNPTLFNDFLYFQVRDISKTGVRLATSLRNRFLIPGLTLEATVSFPMFGSLKLNLKIVDVRTIAIRGKDMLSIGATIIAPRKSDHSVIANYILQFASNVSPEEAKVDGMIPKTMSGKVTYSFVRTKEEYEEVLELRKRSYLAAGKLKEEITKESLSDEFDSRARILTARYRGKLISSLRIIFHLHTDTLEIQKYITLPKNMPSKDQFVEVSRFCIDPAFQGGDIVFGMMQQLFVVMAQSKRKWIVSFADEKMMKSFYRPFGSESLGVKFEHPVLNSMIHEAFLFDIEKLITGKTVGPVLWNLLLSDIFQFMQTNDYYSYDRLTQLRIRFYKLFKPLAKMLQKKLMQPKFVTSAR